MTKPIEFFFDFVSPFGWFAAERIGGIARTYCRDVAWRPMLLGVTVKQVMGLAGAARDPAQRALHPPRRRAMRTLLRPLLASAHAHDLLLRCGRARGLLGRCPTRPW